MQLFAKTFSIYCFFGVIGINFVGAVAHGTGEDLARMEAKRFERLCQIQTSGFEQHVCQ